MRNNKWLIIVAVLLIAVAGIWWWSSSSSSSSSQSPGGAIAEGLTPEIDILSVRITNISDDRVDVIAEVILKNSLPVEFSSSSMEYEAYIDSIKVVEDVHNDPVTLNSGDSTVIELPLEVRVDPLDQVLSYFKENNIDSAHYALNASVILDVPIEGKEEFDLELSDTLPAFKKMEFSIEEVETNILSSDDGLDLIIRARNFNNFPTEIRSGSFSITIKDEMQVVGQLEEVVYIPANGTEDIAIHAEKEWGSLTQSAKDFIFNQEDTRFSIHFNGIMHSDNKMLNETEVDLRVNGTLDELSEAVGN
jgi:LEA14-like dessication related protein